MYIIIEWFLCEPMVALDRYDRATLKFNTYEDALKYAHDNLTKGYYKIISLGDII